MAENNLYFYLVDLYRGTTLESIVSVCERMISDNYSDERVLCSAPQTSSEKRTWERYLV